MHKHNVRTYSERVLYTDINVSDYYIVFDLFTLPAPGVVLGVYCDVLTGFTSGGIIKNIGLEVRQMPPGPIFMPRQSILGTGIKGDLVGGMGQTDYMARSGGLIKARVDSADSPPEDLDQLVAGEMIIRVTYLDLSY